ncbi:hypothetical protein LCGC14_1928350 [marine sediment metagenome]|uniref:Spore protein YkvP/CgeB glycosyl transferase-like domain-containing protein n=1 Tax=marine sediment metagenome TaxID=412755 RepID=A0A0F9I2L7_9ZZZZ
MTKKKLRIAITYMAYPLCMARYFHEALLRRDDTEVWCAAPYSGRWLPWGGPQGMELPEKYLRVPDLPLPYTPPRLSYMIVQNQCPWQPDLWLEVNSTFDAMGRPTNAPLAIVGADPHVLDYSDARRRADVFFNMQSPYLQPNDEWLPYAYDPIWHSSTPIRFSQRTYDATLIGLQYDNRRNLFSKLRGLGYNCFTDTGPCYEDARAIYHQTKVGVNWSSLLDTTARVFEVMGFGIAPVFNRVPDLMELFQDGRDFEGFDNEAEAIAKISALLNDPLRAEELGRNARIAVEPHTWDARIQQIFEKMNIV